METENRSWQQNGLHAGGAELGERSFGDGFEMVCGDCA
jgi:hypothetical protein